jgi:hypothetical protein
LVHQDKKGKEMITKGISWLLWIVLLVTFLIYVPVMQDLVARPGVLPINSAVINLPLFLKILYTLVVILLAAATISLRHFALIKPAKRVNLPKWSAKWKVRFLLVHLLNWIFLTPIIIYGMVIVIVTKQIEWIYLFSCVYVALMLLHSPRSVFPQKAQSNP